jgi:O-antigen/teichoic acid export membrane protein
LSRRDSGFIGDNEDESPEIPAQELSLGVFNLKSAARKYLASRAMASGLALSLSILYSLELGPQNRGFITIVMTFSILTIVSLMGGTTLTARKIGISQFSDDLRDSYRVLILVEIILGLIVFLVLLTIYSISKQTIPGPLILASAMYFIASSYHFAAIEWQITQKKLKVAGSAEVVTILIQILAYYLILKTELFSSAVTVLVAFAFSYFLIGFWCNFNTGFSQNSFKLLSNPRIFFARTKGHHLLGIIINLLDRMDRIVISLLFPPAALAKYAAMSGVLAFLRFVPDALSKIAITGNGIIPKALRKKKGQTILFVVVLIFVFVVSARKFIEIILGVNWLLPYSVFATFCLYELIRGTFQVYANKTIQQGSEMLTQRSVVYVLFSLVFILPVIVFFFGLSGVPLSLATAYLLGTLVLLRLQRG